MLLLKLEVSILTVVKINVMKETKNNPLIEFFKNINLAISKLVNVDELDSDVKLEGELAGDPKEAYDEFQNSAVSSKSRVRVSNVQRAPEIGKPLEAAQIRTSRTPKNFATDSTQKNTAKNDEQKNVVRDDEHDL